MKKLLLSIACIFMGQTAFACSELLDSEMRILDSAESQNLCKYEGKTLLVVNVASRCGYTYQYASLQALYEKYKEEDFVVLGIPSRDFFRNTLTKVMWQNFVQQNMESISQCSQQ